MVDLAGARWTGATDEVGELPEPPVVHFRTGRANRIIGVEIDEQEQKDALERLGFDVVPGWDVHVPTWRMRDVTREIDLVEEVARVHGLEKIPFTLPLRSAMSGRLSQAQRLRRLVEDVLAGAGFSEAYTLSLVARDPDPDALRLPVPLTSEHGVLRTTLLDGLVGAARHNVAVGNEGIALFEVARVYLPSGEQLPEERWRVGAIAQGGYPRAKGAVETLYEALGIEPALERARLPFLHPGKAAALEAGWVGELHPALLEGEWGVFELDLDTLFAQVPERVEYEDVVSYPAVHQDLAFVVGEEVLAGELIEAAREAAGPELRDAAVFDVYRGEPIPAGRKSVALHVSLPVARADALRRGRPRHQGAHRRGSRREVRCRAPRVGSSSSSATPTGGSSELHPICAARLEFAAGLAEEGDAVLLSGWSRPPRPAARGRADAPGLARPGGRAPQRPRRASHGAERGERRRARPRAGRPRGRRRHVVLAPCARPRALPLASTRRRAQRRRRPHARLAAQLPPRGRGFPARAIPAADGPPR